MTTVADAIDVMAVVAACHHRTAPRMDDREATVATATVWADLFSVYKLSLDDLVAGVKRRALSHAEAPEPAEIITFAREVRARRANDELPTPEYELRCELKGEDTREQALNKQKLAALTAGFGKSIPDA